MVAREDITVAITTYKRPPSAASRLVVACSASTHSSDVRLSSTTPGPVVMR